MKIADDCPNTREPPDAHILSSFSACRIIAIGPEPTFMPSVGAALRLPETGHSCVVQHF